MASLTDYYYEYHFGYYNEKDTANYNTTQNTISYLIDNNISNNDICFIIKNTKPKISFEIKDLPDKLWENSLTKRDVFYYHKELHITSEAPVYNTNTRTLKSSKFFLEMKIKYTIDDLLNYYKSQVNIYDELFDDKRERGAIKYILKTYNKISIIEPLDFVLSLIDIASKNKVPMSNILDLQKYEGETYEYLEHRVKMAKAYKYDRIIWRE